jgi:DNA-binding FadR family transcriptional regulator
LNDKGERVPIQAVESTRLYRQIAGQIAALIDNREFPAGSRLPPERELAVLLGVSRTSVREAIIALELAGRVEVRVGTGIFVTDPGSARRRDAGAGSPTSAVDDGGAGPFDLLAARAMIEGEVAALAARNIRKSDLAALRETIARMREHADDFARRDAADREFHVLIAEATRNGALPTAVAGLWDQRRGELWTRIEDHFHTPALREKTLLDHEAIVAALEAHDADAAREAMHRHLRRVAREFQRRWDETGGGSKKGGTRGTAKRPAKKSTRQHAPRRIHQGGSPS